MSTEYSGLDIEEMGRVIDEAGVMIIRFHVISQRLLVDTRSADDHPAMLRLVPPVSSAEERYRHLQTLRPNVPLPDQITVLSWPRYVEVMRDAGLWQRLEQRLVELGGPALAQRCDEVFEEVRSAERAEIVAAILGGEGYESLWERTPTT